MEAMLDVDYRARLNVVPSSRLQRGATDHSGPSSNYRFGSSPGALSGNSKGMGRAMGGARVSGISRSSASGSGSTHRTAAAPPRHARPTQEARGDGKGKGKGKAEGEVIELLSSDEDQPEGTRKNAKQRQDGVPLMRDRWERKEESGGIRHGSSRSATSSLRSSKAKTQPKRPRRDRIDSPRSSSPSRASSASRDRFELYSSDESDDPIARPLSPLPTFTHRRAPERVEQAPQLIKKRRSGSRSLSPDPQYLSAERKTHSRLPTRKDPTSGDRKREITSKKVDRTANLRRQEKGIPDSAALVVEEPVVDVDADAEMKRIDDDYQAQIKAGAEEAARKKEAVAHQLDIAAQVQQSTLQLLKEQEAVRRAMDLEQELEEEREEVERQRAAQWTDKAQGQAQAGSAMDNDWVDGTRADEPNLGEKADGSIRCRFCPLYLPFNAPLAILREMDYLASLAEPCPTVDHPQKLKLEYNMRMAFCGKHRHETEYGETAAKEGYPRAGEVDWRGMWDRLEQVEVRRAIQKICARPDKSSLYRQVQRDLEQMGRVKWEEEYRGQKGMDITHAGYYGDVGRIVIEAYLLNLSIWGLLPMFAPVASTSAGHRHEELKPVEFIRHVLMPEVAIALLMQDRCNKHQDHDADAPDATGTSSRAGALKVWKASAEYGRHVFPADGPEDEAVQGWLGNQDLMRRAREAAISNREADVRSRIQARVPDIKTGRGQNAGEVVIVDSDSENEAVETTHHASVTATAKKRGPNQELASQLDTRRGRRITLVPNGRDLPETTSSSSGASTAPHFFGIMTTDEIHHIDFDDTPKAARRMAGTIAPGGGNTNTPPQAASQDSVLGGGEDWLAKCTDSQMDQLFVSS